MLALVTSIAAAEGIAFPPPADADAGTDAGAPAAPVVVVARDTRPSSPHLTELVKRGAAAAGARVTDYGLLTTPQLHHIVRVTNTSDRVLRERYSGGEGGYWAMLKDGFRMLLAGTPPAPEARGPLVLDCANGIGGLKSADMARELSGVVSFQLRNTGQTEAEAALLNEGCGAEHVQKGRLPPAGFTAAGDAGKRCASLDGDADRLVYHYFASAEGGATGLDGWRLLDGDKIACLAAAFIADQLTAAGLTITPTPTHGHDDHSSSGGGASAPAAPTTAAAAVAALRSRPISVGIVQTAYANGASTRYIKDVLHLPVVMAKTGVKYVHHAAQAFDLGVYFEANGHGTVLFHSDFAATLAAAVAEGDAALVAAAGSEAAAVAVRRLYAATLLINQAIGDALSDCLFAEAVLAVKGWTVQDWDAIYTDLPSRQAKLAVKDRTAITTVPDETRVVSPAALQEALDSLVAAVPSGRAFVRPSGTEDVVRVYAEAATQDAANELARQVSKVTYALAGGVGPEPA